MKSVLIEKLWNQAMNYHKSGNLDMALDIITKAIDGDEEKNKDALLQHLYWTRSDIFTKLEKYDIALSDLEEAIRLCQDHLRYVMFISRAEIYRKMGKYDLSIIDYTVVINNCIVDKDYIEEYCLEHFSYLCALYEDRANVYKEKGCMELAEKDSIKVLKIREEYNFENIKPKYYEKLKLNYNDS